MIILTGVMLMVNPLNSPWIIEKTFVNILKIISGGFIALLGTVIFLSGISENAAESVSGFLGYLWDRFLEALGK